MVMWKTLWLAQKGVAVPKELPAVVLSHSSLNFPAPQLNIVGVRSYGGRPELILIKMTTTTCVVLCTRDFINTNSSQ